MGSCCSGLQKPVLEAVKDGVQCGLVHVGGDTGGDPWIDISLTFKAFCGEADGDADARGGVVGGDINGGDGKAAQAHALEVGIPFFELAAHGAGRAMSRSAAFKTLDKTVIAANLVEKRITLMGSDIDEAPMAYKDIHTVMAAQNDLVDVLAKFEPRIVRMADAKEKPED